MDRELTELRLLGLGGIYKESCKLIFSFKKIFSQITLSLIIPLSFIFLAQIQISDLLFGKIIDDETDPDGNYTNRNHLSSEWAFFWLFRAVYLFFLIILSLLSTSAVVYTIACIYTAKPITLKKVLSVVPKVWKRLLITFFWNFIVLIAYHVAVVVVLVLWAVSFGHSVPGLVVLIILIILYLIGLVYISVVWELASVVSVLEELYGFKAMRKSRGLIKGKMFAAGFIFVVMQIFLIGIEVLYEVFVVDGVHLHMIFRVMIGIGCFVLAVVVMLYGLVTQTVIYFVCKSYHNENIDKSGLADHLEGYLGEYVRLNGRRDVQLGEVNV